MEVRGLGLYRGCGQWTHSQKSAPLCEIRISLRHGTRYTPKRTKGHRRAIGRDHFPQQCQSRCWTSKLPRGPATSAGQRSMLCASIRTVLCTCRVSAPKMETDGPERSSVVTGPPDSHPVPQDTIHELSYCSVQLHVWAWLPPFPGSRVSQALSLTLVGTWGTCNVHVRMLEYLCMPLKFRTAACTPAISTSSRANSTSPCHFWCLHIQSEHRQMQCYTIAIATHTNRPPSSCS